VRGGRTWLLRNSASGGPADIAFEYGVPGDVPVVGDWNGDGRDSPGVVRAAPTEEPPPDTEPPPPPGEEGPADMVWLLRNSCSGGPADLTFTYGTTDDRLLVWARP
jgi:hypothetical protein